jgi:hypothetical protein
MERIVLAEKLAAITDCWQPHIVAELNGQQVKLAKLRGEFVWHHHEHEDELFLVVSGRLKMELRDRTEELGPGEMIVVRRAAPPGGRGRDRDPLFEPTHLNTATCATSVCGRRRASDPRATATTERRSR